MDGDLLPRRAGLTPEKITREHQQRLAIMYIRQSTPQQVERNQESTKLQYALVDRAFHFGWARETIVTIDDDLSRSGSTIEGRLGFQRLVAEVGLGHVGLVLGIEMSRLARSCRDWHQLLEICALFDTLIADADGVYDPANYNDRLPLGLKGTMSEAELHILQARMLAGRNTKARRGELGKPLPMRYLRRPSGEAALDPGEQAQGVIRMAFELFERFRTVSGVLRYLVENDIKMPVRLMNINTRTQIIDALGKNPNARSVARQIGDVSHVSVWKIAKDERIELAAGKAIKGKPGISPGMRGRIIEALRGSNANPRLIARRIRQHKSRDCLENI